MGIRLELSTSQPALRYTNPKKKFTMAKKAAKEDSLAKPEAKKSGITKPMKLSDDLAAVVGQKQASRAECIKQLWAYLKKNNLQDPENKQYFTPDKKMAKIFGTEKIRGFGMAKFPKTNNISLQIRRWLRSLEPRKSEVLEWLSS